MVYGFFNLKQRKFYKNTRVSSSAKLIDKINIDLKNDVWVGHYCLLDGIGGITIERGVNIASHSCIYTHSSQNSIRLLGEKYIQIPRDERIGYLLGAVYVGEYSFIGTSCVILHGTSLGKGCIVAAGSVVRGKFPDYSVIAGNPAKVIGDTRTIDKELFDDGVDFKDYYDQKVVTDNFSIY